MPVSPRIPPSEAPVPPQRPDQATPARPVAPLESGPYPAGSLDATRRRRSPAGRPPRTPIRQQNPEASVAQLSRQKQIVGLAAWLGVSLIAALIGSAASVQAGPFYTELSRPAWAPPSWLFGPVWSVLYAMMGVAAWLVWREGGFRAARSALTLFLAQLALNALWSWLFFGWHRGALAFADILLLWALIVATLLAFRPIRPLAGVPLIPYRL